ncbi:MAG TPA: DUF5989 family protein [Planctomycetota bacterium]|nr:DUF5989 family protein [Planctomycetota bacterium]
MTERDHDDFENLAADAKSGGIVSEFIAFMKDNAKWWLIPFLVVFGLLGIVIVLAGTGAAPFIYAMF